MLICESLQDEIDDLLCLTPHAFPAPSVIEGTRHQSRVSLRLVSTTSAPYALITSRTGQLNLLCSLCSAPISLFQLARQESLVMQSSALLSGLITFVLYIWNGIWYSLAIFYVRHAHRCGFKRCPLCFGGVTDTKLRRNHNSKQLNES